MDILSVVRSECLGLSSYVAGRPISTIKRELGLSSVIKLASNENPLGSSLAAISAIRENLRDTYLYPDADGYELKNAISVKYGISRENIFLGAGGDEIIDMVAKLFFNSNDEVVVSKHTFVQYKRAIQLMGSKMVAVDMSSDFVHDLDSMSKFCNKNTKAIFITNPNNPTGTYNTKAELDRFLKNLPVNKFGIKPIVILDEAYFEYAVDNEDYPDGLSFLKENPNLIVLRTFSKIYGLAGLRVGYGFASKEVVDFINRVRLPFNVNAVAQVAASAAIFDTEHVLKSCRLVREEKEYLYSEFDSAKITYLKSASNFILCQTLPLSGKEVFLGLIRDGIITRSVEEYDLQFWLRVTIGKHEENEFFIKKFRNILKK
ncbi:MAG: histidinol-phosphate transaminase [Elusimicrobiota bacterium]|jgi:histidinol-phosphate aminotransferase|nr:histidinol-phosphate transaminase [Elusimicrobiota bacterium]